MKLAQKAITALAATAAVLLGASAASAASVTNPPFTLSDKSFGGPCGVHGNGGKQMGMTINAHVMCDGSAATFTSSSNLSQTGSGEAILNGPFTDITVDFAHTWGSVTFAFQNVNATPANGMSIFVNDSATANFSPSNCSFCSFSGMGLEKFTITGAPIDELTFQFTQPVDNAKQFRVAFGAPIPEPATWALMIVGVGMIGFAARRRNAGLALAA